MFNILRMFRKKPVPVAVLVQPPVKQIMTIRFPSGVVVEVPKGMTINVNGKKVKLVRYKEGDFFDDAA